MKAKAYVLGRLAKEEAVANDLAVQFGEAAATLWMERARLRHTVRLLSQANHELRHARQQEQGVLEASRRAFILQTEAQAYAASMWRARVELGRVTEALKYKERDVLDCVRFLEELEGAA